MSQPATASVVAVTALLSLAAAAIAWSIGAALANDITDPDYMVQPIEALVDARWAILVVALILATASAVVLVRISRSGGVVKPGVVAPIVGIGIAVGGGYAVITAPVIGANIGGGMVMMALPIVVVFLLFTAVRAARRP